MSNDDLWAIAGDSARDDILEGQITQARIAAAEQWPFLAAARSRAEYEDRKALVGDRLEHVAASIAGKDPVLFGVLHSAILSGLDEDFVVLDTERTRQAQVTAARKTASVAWIAEVAGSGEGTWSRNSMTYETPEAATAAAKDLLSRWFGADMARVVPAETPARGAIDPLDPTIVVNYRTASRKTAADHPKVKGIAIYPDKRVEDVTLDGLESMQAIVKGYIEPITLKDGSTMYANEDGLSQFTSADMNWIAADVCGLGGVPQFMFNGALWGPVFIVGPVDGDGYDTDVTTAARQWVQRVKREAGGPDWKTGARKTAMVYTVGLEWNGSFTPPGPGLQQGQQYVVRIASPGMAYQGGFDTREEAEAWVAAQGGRVASRKTAAADIIFVGTEKMFSSSGHGLGSPRWENMSDGSILGNVLKTPVGYEWSVKFHPTGNPWDAPDARGVASSFEDAKAAGDAALRGAGVLASRKQADVDEEGYEIPKPTWSKPCERCGNTIERYRGQGDVTCGKCGAEYNAGGQRLRDDWRGNSSNYDSDVDDMEGFERQQLGYEGSRRQARRVLAADNPFAKKDDAKKDDAPKDDEKKPNPFAKKDDADPAAKDDAKKDDGGNPFGKKDDPDAADDTDTDVAADPAAGTTPDATFDDSKAQALISSGYQVLTQGGKTLDEALAAGEPVQFQPAAAATPDPAAVDPAAAPAAVDPTKKASRSRLPFAREAGGNNEEGTSDDFNGGSAFGGKIAPDVLRALYHADPDGMETQPTQADYDDFHDWVVRQYGEATFLAYASGEEMDHFASRKSSRQIIPGWPVFWLKTASGESLCSERTGAILGSYRRDGGVFVWRTDDISGAARTTDSARTFVERAVRSFNYTAGRER